MSKKTKNLATALNEMQSQVIGLFHPRFYPKGEYICVIDDENGVLNCIEVMGMLCHSTLCIVSEQGRYVKFPDGKTLTDMKEDVIDFTTWYDTNIKNK